VEAVFAIFDTDGSGNLDMCEVANSLAILCGGSVSDKIYAAFNLFDANDSMTLSFDELNEFIKCTF
jgi:Ca2+-binding EF-hand superfamily protein